MTAPAVPDHEVQRRAAQLMVASGTLHYDQALAQAVGQLEVERAEEAERMAKTREITDSMAALWSCRMCGANAGPGSRDGLCPDCRTVNYVLDGLELADQTVGGRTRRDLWQAMHTRQQKAG